MDYPNTDLQSKIDRAIRAVLLDQGAATKENCYAAPASEARILTNCTIASGDGHPFDGPGNWQFPNVTLNLRDDGSVQPDMADANQPRTDANARMTKIFNALNRSDDEHTLYYTATEITRLGRLLSVDVSSGSDPTLAQEAADNADMADFTMLWWEAGIVGTPVKHDSETTFWERDLQFSCVACNAAF